MSKKAPELKGRTRSAIAENLWLPVQILALVAILFSTILAGSQSPVAKADNAESEAEASFSSPYRPVSVSLPPRSITSRVVVLPLPSSPSARAGLSLEIETRQLRFERTAGGELRAPAALTGAPWRLAKIRRRSGERWENVPLVENDRRQTLGSAFLELEEGWNEFEVVFSDAAGHEASYPVRVNHVKMNTT